MSRDSILRSALLAVLVAAAALAPLVVGFGSQRLLARMFVFALLALSLNIIVGNLGLASFGHGLYFGAGAYSVALLWSHFGWPATLGLVAAPLVTMVMAAACSLVIFRAQRLYFGLLTLALAQLGFVLASQWTSLTAGENGVHGVELPSWLSSTRDRYWFVLAVVVVGTALINTLLSSPFGATLRAVRQNRERAQFLGLEPLRYEVAAYVISAGFAGLAGGLLIVLNQNAFPLLLHWSVSAEPLLMIVIGGAGFFSGPLVGACAVIYLQDFLRDGTGHVNLVYGTVALVLALYARDGLLGLSKLARPSPLRRHRHEPSDAPGSEVPTAVSP